MLVTLVTLVFCLHQLVLLVIPNEKLWLATFEAHQELAILAYLNWHYRSEQVNWSIDYFVTTLETPNSAVVSLAYRNEYLFFSHLVDLFDCMPVDGEASIYMIHIINLNEDYCAFGETKYNESVKISAILVFLEDVFWIYRLLISIQIREYLTIFLGWLSIRSRNTCDTLLDAFAFVIF
jgi:hypothetical protein